MSTQSITGHIEGCAEVQWSFECEDDANSWTEDEMKPIISVLTKWLTGLYKQYEMHSNNYWHIKKCIIDGRQAFIVTRYTWRYHWTRKTVQEVAQAIDEHYKR